jgi:dolichol-phosphate mannosyltransferase
MKKFIIIPTYNEAENLPLLIQQIFNLNISDLNIIIIDDHSPDGTGQIAEQLRKTSPLTVIHRAGKLGLGSAYILGFQKALALGAEIILEMDADFSHNPQDLPRLIGEIANGYDLVIGSRRVKGGSVKGWNFWRNLESRLAMNFARFILNLKTKDITAGFRCFQASALRSLNFDKIKSNGYSFQEEMVYIFERQGFKIKEIPIEFIDRRFGRSKLGLKDVLEFFVTILRLRFKKP